MSNKEVSGICPCLGGALPRIQEAEQVRSEQVQGIRQLELFRDLKPPSGPFRGIVWRGTQEEDFKRVLASVEKGDNTLLFADVGYGKTIVALAVVQEFLKKGKRVLFVVSRTAIVNQVIKLARTLFDEEFKDRIARVDGETNRTKRAELYKNNSFLFLVGGNAVGNDLEYHPAVLNDFSLLVVDEADLVRKDHPLVKVVNAFKNQRKPIVALTATPVSGKQEEVPAHSLCNLFDISSEVVVVNASKRTIREWTETVNYKDSQFKDIYNAAKNLFNHRRRRYSALRKMIDDPKVLKFLDDAQKKYPARDKTPWIPPRKVLLELKKLVFGNRELVSITSELLVLDTYWRYLSRAGRVCFLENIALAFFKEYKYRKAPRKYYKRIFSPEEPTARFFMTQVFDVVAKGTPFEGFYRRRSFKEYSERTGGKNKNLPYNLVVKFMAEDMLTDCRWDCAKEESLAKQISYLLSENPKRLIMVYLDNVNYGVWLAKRLNFLAKNRLDLGKGAQAIRAVACTGQRSGRLTKKERGRNLQLVREGKANVLITTTALERGVDLPKADVLIRLNQTTEGDKFYQLLGRVGREEGKLAVVINLVVPSEIKELMIGRKRALRIARRRKEGVQQSFKFN
ncbi:MAG: DEAD/DEAH box helicase [Candidatus Dadabacteria bacterium]|nr:MAG: DEAD/DEAH box helicase [Candidatus Dadabacteria bacterium]